VHQLKIKVLNIPCSVFRPEISNYFLFSRVCRVPIVSCYPNRTNVGNSTNCISLCELWKPRVLIIMN